MIYRSPSPSGMRVTAGCKLGISWPAELQNWELLASCPRMDLTPAAAAATGWSAGNPWKDVLTVHGCPGGRAAAEGRHLPGVAGGEGGGRHRRPSAAGCTAVRRRVGRHRLLPGEPPALEDGGYRLKRNIHDQAETCPNYTNLRAVGTAPCLSSMAELLRTQHALSIRLAKCGFGNTITVSKAWRCVQGSSTVCLCAGPCRGQPGGADPAGRGDGFCNCCRPRSYPCFIPLSGSLYEPSLHKTFQGYLNLRRGFARACLVR